MATALLPTYKRTRLTPGIVHIGLGNFHRAHLAVYMDDLFAMGLNHDWAIIGAGVRPADGQMRAALRAQDHLSTVIELDPTGRSARRIGAMIDFLPVEPDNASLIAAMCRPECRIVSLSLSLGGYFVDSQGQFDATSPEIVADGANPTRPTTAFGAIVAALRARRLAGIMPFTVMSCDNLPGNGNVARNAVVGTARLSDPDLAAWISQNVAFPNAMVDRITPATGPRELAIAAEFGLGEDPVPVTCEPFRQWVLEDNFPAGRPAWEKVGATFTPHVHAYETMKIRILNGGHALIAYPGGLKGIHFVHEAMADPLIAAFLDAVQTREILPIVPPVPGQNLGDYKALVIARFSNPDVADTERRLCLDGSNRQPKFIIPSIRDALAAGHKAEGLTLLSALWCRYCYGVTEAGEKIAPNDPNWDALQACAKAARTTPAVWIAMDQVYGDLIKDAGFVARFCEALDYVWAKGVDAALQRYLGL